MSSLISKKVFYMDGWLIIYVYCVDFDGWDSFSYRGVCRGHLREMKAKVWILREEVKVFAKRM